MASFAEHKKILKQIEAFKPQLNKIVEAAGVLAVTHFTKSFANQGFTDESLSTWQPRKRSERGKSRAILVKSGRLRRSLRSKRFGSLAVKIMTDVPYARIHNDGGLIEREFDRKILSFTSGGRFAKTKTRKNRKEVSYQQQVTINAHSIRMPKRQFIGYSGQLNRKIIAMIDKNIKRQFNK
jgi:phage gpG-like protein